MSASSGEAGPAQMERFERASFVHTASGFRYRVGRSSGRYFIEFEKTSDASLHGKKALAYFVGSGAVARSYLLAVGGFLYEAPVTYYSGAGKWDLAPGYDSYAYPFLTRPILPACLNCHASFPDVVQEAQNRFGATPFREGGVACERCHGPGEAHIAKMKAGRMEGGIAIVNPAKLAPDRRDSICAQCHLSGEVRVMRPGATWQSYHAGDRLEDSVKVFVAAGASPGMRVTSHFEKLAQSACKQASGDRLWCGTCHDPHALPVAIRPRPMVSRQMPGLSCSSRMHRNRYRRALRGKDDCTACHMPKNPVTDAQHVVYTDHSIPRRPRTAIPAPPAGAELVPFGEAAASKRDVALAYAGIAAVRQRTAASQDRARQLLEQVEQSSPEDSEVLLYLAEIYRNSGLEERAIPLYRRAMQIDPAQVTASVGLGGILFEHGEYPAAIRLWQDALSKNSGLVLVSTNLAMAQWRTGRSRGRGIEHYAD